MKKSLFNIMLVVAAIVGTSNSRAADPVLSDELREAVAALEVVQNESGVQFAYLQDKPVIVSFFASWCPPCLEEFLHINKLYSLYGESDVAFVAINVFEAWDNNDEARMEAFLQRTQPQFPVVAGNEAIRARFGGIDRIPTVYGFLNDGTLSYDFIHEQGSVKTNASFEELEQAVKLLLDK